MSLDTYLISHLRNMSPTLEIAATQSLCYTEYGSHTVNMIHIAMMLYGHTDQ